MANAPEIIVEYAKATGSPASFGPWQLAYHAKCTEIVQNHGSTPDSAKIVLNAQRWNNPWPLWYDDRVRVRTVEHPAGKSTLLFDGVISAWTPHYSGSAKGGTEQCEFLAEDFRYLINASHQIYGQWAFNQDAYPTKVTTDGTYCWDDSTSELWINGYRNPTRTKHVVDGPVTSQGQIYQNLFLAGGRRCVFNGNDGPRGKTTPNMS
ncbi:unnamed protein product, partial [marine sediment metagenome]